MAELNVEKKSGGVPWWVWLVIGLAVLGLIIFLMAGNNQTDADRGDRDRDRDDTVRRTPTTELAPKHAEWDYVSMKTQYPSLEEFPFDQH